VIIEALVIGLGASIVGLFCGLGLAVGLNELFEALNLDLPQTETVFATRTIVVSLLVGTLVTLVAGLFPAIRATKVPPIAAVREGATMPRGRFARFTPYIAAVIVALAVLALGYGTLANDIAVGDRFALLGVGVLSLFIGVAMLSSRLVRPLVRLVGIPARRMGGAAGKLAEGNSQRNPGRTAATAAALMIGIALVTFVAVLANGLRVSNSDAIERQIQSDLIVTSQDGYSEFPAAVGDAVEDAQGVETVSNVRQDIAQIDGDGANLTGLDGQINEVYDFRWEEGSDAVLTRLGDDGAVLPNNVAEDNDLAVGDSFTAASTRAARSTRCSARPASRKTHSTISTSGRATASRCSTSRATRRRRSRASRARWRASPTHASRRVRNGSTRRTRRSSSSCCCSTSCSRCP
jgi:putative ABC transport system permease protein